ncbi:hypothetical protein RHGRI_034058 [Rhododendron griersonianum]|uniref:DNA repair RAD52-like protein 2, chloroplastic n=1 Tax=Rhododendron griersonianum TaxID=479676 RepID=A0AAV6HZX3_9ERIC|nr:hypothetical protein RHGRI_034058 [Rhododendron griersonianum]
MAVHSSSFLPHPRILPAKSGFPSLHFCRNRWTSTTNLTSTGTASAGISVSGSRRNSAGGAWVRVSALDRSNSGSSNYVVPLDASSCITRPLAEILRDLNKRIPDNIIINNTNTTFIPWYHANRMLSFYAPGWCGEVRDVIFSDNGSVTVVYRVTIRGSDGEAHRESSGTVSSGSSLDPVAAAEEIAFCRACARFGLGLYLYHDE